MKVNAMRCLWTLIASAGLSLAPGPPLSAETLDPAKSSFELSIGGVGGMVTPREADSSLTIGEDGSIAVPASVFATNAAIDENLFTGVPLISSLTINAANAAATFAPGRANPVSNGVVVPGTGLGGPMALQGGSVVGILGGLITIDVPFDTVGVGGTPVMAGAAALKITVTGASWTTGVARVTGITTVTELGGVLSTVEASGSQITTTGGNRQVRLVSPVRIVTNTVGNLPAFSIMTLNFAPEPGATLGALAAAGGLVLLGRRRRSGMS